MNRKTVVAVYGTHQQSREATKIVSHPEAPSRDKSMERLSSE